MLIVLFAYFKAKVLQWVEFCENHIRCNVGASLNAVFGDSLKLKYCPPENCTNTELECNLKFLDQLFLKSTFLADERITLADITLFSLLLPVYVYNLFPAMSNLINVNRWMNTVGPLHYSIISFVKPVALIFKFVMFLDS